jgi:hypothetical protein
VHKNQLSRQTGSRTDGSKNATHNMVYLYDACDKISEFCCQQLLRKMRRKIFWTLQTRWIQLFDEIFAQKIINYQFLSYDIEST